MAEIAPLLRRSVGRPPRKPIISYDEFWYQTGGWDRPRRVVFQFAEVAVPLEVFRQVPERIGGLHAAPA